MGIADDFSTKKAKDLFISEDSTEIIYLRDDLVFERFYVHADHDLKERYAGTYVPGDKELRFRKDDGGESFTLVYQGNDHLISDEGQHFYRIDSALLQENFLLKRAIYMGKKFLSHTRLNGIPKICTGKDL
ncbi:hypothetical protein GFS24_16385 [Chitinophaga sp. SYP-B3965]|uniref:hypothetical protein n=1 Tax=Chitinophaga sp. SYP-B3965 TaxID=2663120 RepID=UPI001299F6D2|nr:hypothetical protein [Chitinophaga sp. SYP-B3965]MRG46701.1 hypothetical protein [Chitinophaga sp. SYP-B3965]